MKKILVAIDGSDYAKKAITTGCDIAKQYTADLTLIHVMTRVGSAVVPESLREYVNMEHVQITDHDLLQGVAEQILEQGTNQAQEQGVSSATTTLEVGNPAHKIADYAKQNDIDLIVIGSRGLSDLGGLLLGSVSHKVAHLAACSCLLVK